MTDTDYKKMWRKELKLRTEQFNIFNAKARFLVDYLKKIKLPEKILKDVEKILGTK